MHGSSVVNLLTRNFGHDAAIDLKQHFKMLAGTWEFWSKLLRSREIPSQRGGEEPDKLNEVILAYNAEGT